MLASSRHVVSCGVLFLLVVLVSAAAPPAWSAPGDERWSGTILRQAFGQDEPVPSKQEPISFVLNPRTRTISSFEATVLETVRCLPPDEQPPFRDPRYANDTVDTVQARRFEFAGPVKIVGDRHEFGYFEIGRGRVGGEEEGEPGSWRFSAGVYFDIVGNPGMNPGREGFLGQALSGSGFLIESSESDGGRCRTTALQGLAWAVKGPALPQLRIRSSVARSKPFFPNAPFYRLTARVTDRRGRPVSRARVTVVQPPPPAFANDNPTLLRRRADRRGRIAVLVDGFRPVSVTAQAKGFFGRTCGLRVNRARPATSRLRC